MPRRRNKPKVITKKPTPVWLTGSPIGDNQALQSAFSSTFPSGATRHPKTDVRFDLIPPIALRLLAERFALGAKKYTDNNWKRGMPLSVHINHLYQHLHDFLSGIPDSDTGDQEGNLAAMLWNITAIAWEIDQDPPLYTNLIASITKRPEEKEE